MKATVTAGCSDLQAVELTAGNPELQVLDFDPASIENAQFQVGFPKQWNKGTLSFQAFWTADDTGTDQVVWGLRGVAVSDSETIDVAYGSEVQVTDNNQGVANELMVTAESGSLTVGGTPVDNDICYFRIRRYIPGSPAQVPADARLIGIKLFFVNETMTDD
jgi:hypothetical protein